MTVEFDNDIYTIDFTDPANGDFAIQPFTTNGPLSPTSVSLAPGAVTASTTLTLVGRGLPGWGESVIENMVHMLEHFAGPTAPTFVIPGQLWFDTTNTPVDVLKVRNQANDAWNTVLTVGTDLDFGGFKGINVGDATNPTDAMNQQSSDARYVELAGDSMDAAANLTFSGGGEVLGLPAVPSATGAASKEYVDTQIPLVTTPLFVNVSGDTMAGVLTLNADPVAPLQAATKQYTDNKFVELNGDVMTGFLTLSADPTIGPHAATKSYVDSSVGAVGGDGVVFSGLFDGSSSSGTLILSRTTALPDVTITGMNVHPHSSTDVLYTAERGEQLDCSAPDSSQLFTQSTANVEFDVAAKIINSRNRRQFAVGTDFAGQTLTLGFSYPTETNRLEVFVNSGGSGVGSRKIVADERGVAVISLVVNSQTQSVLFASDSTGLPDDATAFTFTIAVDGGGAAAISIAGEDAQVFGESSDAAVLLGTGDGLVTAMNAEFVSGAVPAIAEFDAEDSAILIWSDTTGSSSSVVLVDTGLFAALTPEASILNFTGIAGATLPTGGGTGVWFDASSTSATYRFWFDDTFTVAPAAGGNVLTAIAFTGGESDQGISDLVVAALIGADGDFSAATNGGGASPIIAMTLTTSDTVPDITDGFPEATGALLFVSQEGVTTSITSVGGVDHDYSEDGPALADSTSFTLTVGGSAAPVVGTDEFEIIRIK